MGVTVCTWAKKQTVGGPTKKVILLVLADRASDDNWSTFAGQQTIAREAEVTTRTVQRTLAEFEAMGLLERTERRRPDGYRSSDLITLNRDWDGPLPLDEGSDGEPSGDNESPDDGSPDPLSPDEESPDNVSPCADQGVREEYQATEGQATGSHATSAPTSPDIYANSQATGCPGKELTQSSEHSVEPTENEPAPPRVEIELFAPPAADAADIEAASASVHVIHPERRTQTAPTGRYPSDFEAWYELYPRKRAKAEAAAAWPRARSVAGWEEIIAGLRRSIATWEREKTPPDKIPYPATWLNQRRWEDEPDAVLNTPTSAPKGAASLQRAAERRGLA